MTGQLVEFGLSIYRENPSVFFALISSVIILVFALIMSVNMRRSETRIVFIVVPIALATYLLSINLTDIEHDFFQNLSTEFIGGLLALILFADWITSNEYTFPIIALAIFGVAGIFVWQASLTNDGFYINLSTELLGALITTAVVRRDWLWSTPDITDESINEKHARFENRRRKMERDTAQRLCQLQLNLKGDTPADIDNQLSILTETLDIIYEGRDTKRKGGGYQRILYANCRPIQPLPPAQEYFVAILDGHESAVEKAFQRLDDTFEVQDHAPAIHLTHARVQRRLQIKTPVQSFEKDLNDMTTMFIARWNQSLQTVERPSEDFINGYHQAIDYVCKDLQTSIQHI